jgi:hypothetical protein
MHELKQYKIGRLEATNLRVLTSRRGTFVDFDKIFVFCDKCCVCISKCVFILVKIKCVNSDRICDKVNFTTKLYTCYNTLIDIYQNTHNILSKHTQILQILTHLAGRSCSGT